MPGIIVIPMSMSIGAAIEEISLLVECLSPAELEGLIFYLPL